MHLSALFGLSWLAALPFVLTRPLNDALLGSYDYIVVGGGASGLTVANRLSEDPSVTVLVLEAGDADNWEEGITVPALVGSELVSKYNWGITSVAQTYLDGGTRWMPQGKALGGGTILNALLWNRGNAGDYDDWVELGNPGWAWDDMLPYFKKSETYTPIWSEELAETYQIYSDSDVHGYDGPVSVAYPKYFYNVSIQFFEALNTLGMPTNFDPNDGRHAGGMFLPQDITAQDMTRADARRSYYEPYAARTNFYVSTGQHVTQLIFDQSGCANHKGGPSAGNNTGGDGSGGDDGTSGSGSGGIFGDGPSTSKRDSNLRVVGVEYASGSGSRRSTVFATREVILAAGALHTPQILELSGIGEQSVLDRFNITNNVILPGVGNNLQDHFMATAWSYLYNNSYVYPTDFSTNTTLYDLARQEYYLSRTGPWTNGPPDGVAFPSLSQISNNTIGIAASAAAQTARQYLAEGTDETLIAGYNAMKSLLVSALLDEQRSVIEILNNNGGGMSLSNMRPFTRGHTHITSPDPFAAPAVDPRYGSNPVDLDVLVESIYFNRKVMATPAMQVFGPWEVGPTADADDAAIRAFIKGNAGTEYHPSGTAAMLPLEYGGVVDPTLLVYGFSNLRIVDASIFPVLPAAHLQAVVYGVAEKAADVIKNARTAPIAPYDLSALCSSSAHPAAVASSNAPSHLSRGFAIPTSAVGNKTIVLRRTRATDLATIVSKAASIIDTSHAIHSALLPTTALGARASSRDGAASNGTTHVALGTTAIMSRPSSAASAYGSSGAMTNVTQYRVPETLAASKTAIASSGRVRCSQNVEPTYTQKPNFMQPNHAPVLLPSNVLPLPSFRHGAMPFPGSYPDTHPFDHPWDPEPNYFPKAIESTIPKIFGPAPASNKSHPWSAWPAPGTNITEQAPAYASVISSGSSGALPTSLPNLGSPSIPTSNGGVYGGSYETMVQPMTDGVQAIQYPTGVPTSALQTFKSTSLTIQVSASAVSSGPVAVSQRPLPYDGGVSTAWHGRPLSQPIQTTEVSDASIDELNTHTDKLFGFLRGFFDGA